MRIFCESTGFSRAILDCRHVTTTVVVMIPLVHSSFEDDNSKEGTHGRFSVHSTCMPCILANGHLFPEASILQARMYE